MGGAVAAAAVSRNQEMSRRGISVSALDVQLPKWKLLGHLVLGVCRKLREGVGSCRAPGCWDVRRCDQKEHFMQARDTRHDFGPAVNVVETASRQAEGTAMPHHNRCYSIGVWC